LLFEDVFGAGGGGVDQAVHCGFLDVLPRRFPRSRKRCRSGERLTQVHQRL
jgi:hypothetical protein